MCTEHRCASVEYAYYILILLAYDIGLHVCSTYLEACSRISQFELHSIWLLFSQLSALVAVWMAESVWHQRHATVPQGGQGKIVNQVSTCELHMIEHLST